VYGTDINPYAVAIARFRLTLAFLEKAGFTKIADAPGLRQGALVRERGGGHCTRGLKELTNRLEKVREQ
jgi:hypothetical protein